ncbi:hypothetical protein HRR83_005569 [Exophiala dermatitidis]|nr:hypothetical protein HRR74_009191 [Exophiala dermatitidis]KAJ4508159.1 hypothetical protein HRR73_007598 [Exophiala dermatitidis]KAJ4531917.1 hypothetical protein HRR77_009048 [Exophiala dermatitidis]KAJ4540071.1 hypothetical protein HRR76_003489 [Exophiala dermatitidis]KAJ4561590.1 hypothetical protein HRR81_009289 [Exophiala dermatitidis]
MGASWSSATASSITCIMSVHQRTSCYTAAQGFPMQIPIPRFLCANPPCHFSANVKLPFLSVTVQTSDLPVWVSFFGSTAKWSGYFSHRRIPTSIRRDDFPIVR